jgi:Flp pilus assembly protein TadG
VSLLAPWIFFLFVGVFDFGFYMYSAISTQNAARVAALQTSSAPSVAGNSGLACQYALGELRMLPNVGTSVTSCGSLPVQVTATAITGVDGAPASRVSVTYETVPLIPIPGLLTGRFTLTRIVEMRVKDD